MEKEFMTYGEALKKSFSSKWVVATCPQGEECWCRVIKCDPPLMYRDSLEDLTEKEYKPVSSGSIGKDTVERIVELHNQDLGLRVEKR